MKGREKVMQSHRSTDRSLEQKQRTTAVEQRVVDNTEDDPASVYRKQLAVENKLMRKESALLLSQRNAQLSQRLNNVSSRVDNDIRKPPKSPPTSSRSKIAKQTGGVEQQGTDRRLTTERSAAAAAEYEETGWLHKMLGGFNSPEPPTVRVRMGVATSTLVRINDGVNEDQATLHHRREQERVDAALMTNREPWNNTARHYVPSALRGLRPSTKEPWAYERNEFDIFGSAWDENGELRPSMTKPIPRTPYDEHLPRKTPAELAMPTATSRSKQKAPKSPTAKARNAARMKEEAEQARIAAERRAQELVRAEEARASHEREMERKREYDTRIALLRLKIADGLLLSTQEKAFLESASQAEELVTVRKLLQRLSATDTEPPNAADVVLLKELVESQLERLRDKVPLLTSDERALMEELETAEGQLRFGGLGSGDSILATSLPNQLEVLIRTFMPKCVPLW